MTPGLSLIGLEAHDSFSGPFVTTVNPRTNSCSLCSVHLTIRHLTYHPCKLDDTLLFVLFTFKAIRVPKTYVTTVMPFKFFNQNICSLAVDNFNTQCTHLHICTLTSTGTQDTSLETSMLSKGMPRWGENLRPRQYIKLSC